MAQRVVLVCDLHGDETSAVETLRFAVDGAGYEIDVCEQHAGEVRERFAGLVGAARRASGGSGALRRRRVRGTGDAAAIREWARTEGIAVPERGRIPAAIAARYAATPH